MRQRVHLPIELIRSRDVSPMEKLLYLGAEAAGPRSISELARLAGIDTGNASRGCAALARAGWFRLARNGRGLVPIPVLPRAAQEQQAKQLTRALGLAPQKGEFLMKRWLDLLVASDDFVDNARPPSLVNPMTGEPLEFDRFYLEGVVFEFNGAQHYGPTQTYPSEQAFKEIRTRDLLKKGMSLEQGIVLVEVIADDLSLDGMRKKVPENLRQSAIDASGAYVKALERMCQEYRSRASG
ncbi:MAG: hypothetical protein ACM3X4_02560 [Ignavibacteriales bacterium]